MAVLTRALAFGVLGAAMVNGSGLEKMKNSIVAQHSAMAEEAAKKARRQLFGTSERSLQRISESQFRDVICALFDGGVEGSTCSCQPSAFAISCTTDETCVSDAPNCGGQEVCISATVGIDFNDRGDVEQVVTAIEYGGAVAYNRTRFRVDGSGACQAFYVLDDLEYQCSRCETCGSGVGGVSEINLDCSNIQPSATTGGCFSSASATDAVAAEENFQLCFNGTSPPVPTTPGMTPVTNLFSAATTTATTTVLWLVGTVAISLVGWAI